MPLVGLACWLEMKEVWPGQQLAEEGFRSLEPLNMKSFVHVSGPKASLKGVSFRLCKREEVLQTYDIL